MPESQKLTPENTQETETEEQKVLDVFTGLKTKLDKNDPISQENRGSGGIMEMKNGKGRFVAFIPSYSTINDDKMDMIVSGANESEKSPKTEISLMTEIGNDGKTKFHLKTTTGDKTETIKDLSPDEAMKILQKIDSRIEETIQIYKEGRKAKIQDAEKLGTTNDTKAEDLLKQLV